MKYWEYITNGMKDDSDGAIPYPIDTSTINSSDSDSGGSDDYDAASYSQKNNVFNDSSPNSDTGDFKDTYDIFKKDDDTSNSNDDDQGFWGGIRKLYQMAQKSFEMGESNSLSKSDNSQGEYTSTASDGDNLYKYGDSAPIQFLDRAGQSAANLLTNGGALNDQSYDTGNDIANSAADVIGTGLGFMENLPGLGTSTSNLLDKTIGNPVENTLNNLADNYGLDNKLYDYATQALKNGTEFGAYQGLSNTIQGKDVGEGVAEGMGTGMLFGAGGKALGDITSLIPGIGKVKPLKDDGNRITFQDENGNVTDMNKAIYDNTAQPIDNTIGKPLTADEFMADTSESNIPKINIENSVTNNTNPLTDEEINTLLNGEDGLPNTMSEVATSEEPFKVANSNIELPNLKDNETEIPISDIIRDDFNPEAAPTQKIVSSNQRSGLKDSVKNAWENFQTHIVDRNTPIKKVGNQSYVKATNSANAGGIVDYIMQKGLVDTSGNKVGDSLSKVVKDIPKKQANDFWEYALQRHNIARSAEDKPIYYRDVNGEQQPYTSAESAERVKYLKQQHPEWKEKADNVTNWLDNFMQKWGVDTGVVNGDLYKSMREQYPDYVPTNREFNDLEDFIPSGSGNGKGFVNQSVPLKKATGSQRNIINPVENIMNLVNRTVRTAKYNEVGQSVLDAVQKDPEGLRDLAEVIPEEALPKTRTDNIVRVLSNGEPTYLKINDKNLLGALENINKSNVGAIEGAAKKATNIFKSLITTKNPLFAISNTARDLPTYLVNSTENNPLKSLWNLGGAYKDILTKSDVYNQYKGLGGGSENFFNSEKPYKSAKELNQHRPLPMLSNGIEAFNNLFETAPRLAEFKDTLKKTGDVDKALYNSGEVTTNFSKGGDYTKHIDSFVPYLNAGIQGLSLMGRQIVNHPIATTVKGLTTITVPTMAIDYMNKDNKNYQALDNRTKDNYYLFPYGDGSKFIKIPKSRELGVLFGSLAERAMRQYEGDKQAWKGFGNTIATNLSPSSPVENNMFAPLIYNLPKNKDFAGRTIVPQSMQDRSPNLQYDEKTSEIAKKIGDLANLSPKQVDYVIKSYTGVLGQFLQPLTTQSTTTGSKLDDILSPVTSRFTADPLYSNQALQDFYDNMDKAKTNASDTNFENNVGSKDKTKEKFLNSEFTRGNKQLSDLTKEAFKAMQSGDMDAVRAARQKMIDIATNENKYIPLPGQDASNLPVPSTELNSDIKDALYKKTSDQAKQLRDETKGVYDNYDLSTEDKTQQMQSLLDQAHEAPQKNPPKKKGRKTYTKKKTAK